MADRVSDSADGLQTVRLSTVDAATRKDLLARYEREVYFPAFPDAEIREDTGYWLGLLDADPPEEAPQPLIEVILFLAADDAVAGGVTIEYYRRADCGLLTYISVAADRRGQGLGRRLVAAARAALTEAAGHTVPMLAETERYDDADDDEEREKTLTRQRQLAKLGAHRIDFDYVMPPLREGLLPHRLHMMAFDDPAPGRSPRIAASTVAAVIQEMADALGSELSIWPEIVAMMAKLRASDSLALMPLEATRFDRRFRETPVFADIAKSSFSFAFELTFLTEDNEPAPKTAFRLERMQEAFELDLHKEVHKALVRPARSFLDDVTTGPPGRNGRPLLLRAAKDDHRSGGCDILMTRDTRWIYEAENKLTELVIGDGTREVPFRLEDTFCVFESGRIFYVLTLVLADGAMIDEYVVVQLQQLALERERADDSTYLGFAMAGGKRHSLAGLANERLDLLDRSTATNALVHVFRAFELQQKGEKRAKLTGDSLRSLCVGIEHDAMLTEAKRVADMFDERGERTDRDVGSRLQQLGDEVLGKAKRAGRAIAAHVRPAPASHGLPREHRSDDDDFDAELLAFAGMAQGVPDFPFQDESEVHDSTRPTARSVEATLYAHPKFLLELGTNWRSFEEGRHDVGTCPYLLLMWLVAVQDELVVTEIEQKIDELIYNPAQKGMRATPLDEVDDVLSKVERSHVHSGAKALKINLKHRFDLFRWLEINRSANVFRYPREKGALEAIQAAMGTAGRFERAEQCVNRTENLVEDVTNLQRTYSDDRTNTLLFILALVGVLGLPKTIMDLLGILYHPAPPTAPMAWDILAMTITLVTFIAVGVAVFLIWRRRQPDQDKRPSKSE